MKLSNLIWVLALAAAVAGCNSGPPIDNAPGGGSGSGGMDGTGGTAGTGGIAGGNGNCTNAEDQAVYAELVYTTGGGVSFTGPDAASEMGSDCIFGAPSSTPPLAGCGAESAAVLNCFPNCPSDTIQAAADCVALCVQDGTADAAPPGLSSECVSCTGDTVACGAAFCTNLCVSDTNAPACIDCRCENNCIQDFDACSGLPSDNEC